MNEESGNRKLWFITRPQRDPTYHREALIALNTVTEHFTKEWKGNRSLQKDYEAQISTDDIKLRHISKDGSGGRTWAAMLRTFGYVYLNEKGYLKLTKAGSKVLKGEAVKENITKQILTLQIPNAYFLDSGFRPKYEDGFRIRPARFLLRLLCLPELERHITKEEITYFALPTKTDDDLQAVAEKIQRFRLSAPPEREKIKADIAETYEHRCRSDSPARDFEEANGDVAHTFMMICRYTDLASYTPGMPLVIGPLKLPTVKRTLEEYDQKYPFKDPNRYATLDLLAQANGLDVNSFKVNDYDGIKPATNYLKKIHKAKRLLASYPNPSELSREKLVSVLCEEFPDYEGRKLAAEIMQSNFSDLDDEFAKSYLMNPNNLDFEDQTGKIFEALGFEVVMRPKPNNNAATEIEILAKYDKSKCCLIDAKNYHEKFALSASLTSHMASEYIPNYDGYDGCTVNHFGYVVANKFGGVSNLDKITLLVKRLLPGREIKGTIVSGRALLGFLDYCRLNDIKMEDRCRIFLQSINNKGCETYQDILDAANCGQC
ncbi:AlwI family type II restriction endonuclease [uncultured Methanocorpusculum sp.]|nr:AlwI family type II restriction endonuclease [uncultured Methanocorpusculum sp.]